MKKPMKVYLAAPRGFCAGVDRAIKIVEIALEKYGAPVYVRHEIVHNKYVVNGLRDKGAIFVKELSDIPANDRPVVFSAHGVPKSVPNEAGRREMFYLDATCPLVSKVHREAERYHKDGHKVILIGHAGHPEVIGTMGQLPAGAVILVETIEDVAALKISNNEPLAYCTQTTLSVDDTAEIINALQTRFPHIKAPRKEDICYATTNRQAAMKAIAEKSDVVFVLGSKNSSNSNRLVEVAHTSGCPRAYLIDGAKLIDWDLLDGAKSIGISAGASAPEILVEEVIDEIKKRYDVTVEEIMVTEENVNFKLPRVLAEKSG